MTKRGPPSASLHWLRRRVWSSAASLLAVSVALSCGLSPVDDLPSAVDGLTVDGSSDGPSLDLVSGAGGASSASGGSPGCVSTIQTECRGSELWAAGVTSTCLYQAMMLACEAGCQDDPDDGGASCVGWGGAGGVGGVGGVAGAVITDGEAP
jgi:hypothetical protein